MVCSSFLSPTTLKLPQITAVANGKKQIFQLHTHQYSVLRNVLLHQAIFFINTDLDIHTSGGPFSLEQNVVAVMLKCSPGRVCQVGLQVQHRPWWHNAHYTKARLQKMLKQSACSILCVGMMLNEANNLTTAKVGDSVGTFFHSLNVSAWRHKALNCQFMHANFHLCTDYCAAATLELPLWKSIKANLIRFSI